MWTIKYIGSQNRQSELSFLGLQACNRSLAPLLLCNLQHTLAVCWQFQAHIRSTSRAKAWCAGPRLRRMHRAVQEHFLDCSPHQKVRMMLVLLAHSEVLLIKERENHYIYYSECRRDCFLEVSRRGINDECSGNAIHAIQIKYKFRVPAFVGAERPEAIDGGTPSTSPRLAAEHGLARSASPSSFSCSKRPSHNASLLVGRHSN